MNKLLLILASFIGARAFMILVGTYTEGAAASFVSCLVYILLFVLFSCPEKSEKAPLGFWKSLTVTLLFLFASYTLSTALDFFFEIKTPEISLLQGAVSVLFVPIAEELFFRATLFKTLDKLTALPVALILSSLIFSLSHAGLSSMIASFVLGAVLTLIYKKTGSVKLPVICHAANNFLAFVLTLKGF